MIDARVFLFIKKNQILCWISISSFGKSSFIYDFIHCNFFETLLEKETECCFKNKFFWVAHKPTVWYVKPKESLYSIQYQSSEQNTFQKMIEEQLP